MPRHSWPHFRQPGRYTVKALSLEYERREGFTQMPVGPVLLQVAA